jgi:hypothetical protein
MCDAGLPTEQGQRDQSESQIAKALQTLQHLQLRMERMESRMDELVSSLRAASDSSRKGAFYITNHASELGLHTYDWRVALLASTHAPTTCGSLRKNSTASYRTNKDVGCGLDQHSFYTLGIDSDGKVSFL